jgi:hypothetical protein
MLPLSLYDTTQNYAVEILNCYNSGSLFVTLCRTREDVQQIL